MKGLTKNNSSPWKWIPSLYFAEGVPYVAVMTISVIMYKRMGVSNTDIALYTSWLYLPWVIKPFWSPFVDILKSKRWWILIMQLLIGAGMAGIAFTIPISFFFQASLVFFWLIAFSSATHDIAADGFYMLALDSNHQAKFVGIRSTFYRFATIAGQGLLIILAGFLESNTGMPPVNFEVKASPHYQQALLHIPETSLPATEENQMYFITSTNPVNINTQKINRDSLLLFMDKIAAHNRQNGFVPYEQKSSGASGVKQASWWTTYVSQPLGSLIENTFGEKRDKGYLESDYAGNVGVLAISLSKQPEEGQEEVLNTSMSRGDKSISLIQGERLVFNSGNWNKAAYMVFQVDPKLSGVSNAEYRGLSGNIPFSWSITFLVMAGIFVLLSFYHKIVLPRPDSDKLRISFTAKSVLKDFSDTFVSFFKKPQAKAAVFFMLTFRFSEAQLLKLINPFLLDAKDVGGLGLTTGEVGLVYGTIGIVGLVLGGIIGGFTAARGGLKKWIWPMTLSMLLTSATFLYLSFSQTDSLLIINICVFIEQFGYGFGFTAYMLYLMYYSDGEHKTAHYAICTGFMALGMMIPGMFAGWLQELLGYNRFFVWIMICSIVPIIAVSLLKIDSRYGKADRKLNK